MSETDLIAPVQYYNQLKGKNIRSIIIYFLGQLFGIKEDILDEISNIGNIIHNASLVIDDIQGNHLMPIIADMQEEIEINKIEENMNKE